MTSSFRLDELVGRRVVDARGRAVGPLEEVVVDPRDGRWTVVEYHVGSAALVERLAGFPPVRALRALFGLRPPAGAYRVPWDRLDLSDPRRPVLRGTADRLDRLDP